MPLQSKKILILSKVIMEDFRSLEKNTGSKIRVIVLQNGKIQTLLRITSLKNMTYIFVVVMA